MTRIEQGFHGWTATTDFDLGGARLLRIYTMKRYGGALVTTATAMKREQGGGVSYFPLDDFTETIISQKVRVTSGAVKLQHNAALAKVSEIKARMEAFYSGKTKELASA